MLFREVAAWYSGDVRQGEVMHIKEKCFFASMLTGIVFGGLLALLLAPRSGEETRAVLRDKIEPVLRKIKAK